MQKKPTIKSRYRLLGSEDSPLICDFCKKKHVQQWWAVEDVVTGEVLRCGSYCIRKALACTVKEFNTGVRAHIREKSGFYFMLVVPLDKKADRIMDAYRDVHNFHVGFLPESETEYWGLMNRVRSITKRKERELLRLVTL